MVAAWLPLVVHPVKDSATERMLAQAAQEPDPVIQELSAEALAFIAGKQPVPLPALEAPPTEQARTAQALRQAADGDAEFILANLHAPAAVLREEAVQAAQRVRLTRAVPALVALLEDEEEGIRLATLAALLVLRPESEQNAILGAIAARMDHELSSQVCEAAGRVLLRWHSAAALPTVLQLLKHPRPLVRLAAVHAVADWNDPGLATELHPLLGDRDVAVGAATAQALEKLANNASRGPLRERLPQAPPLVQEKIAHALGELHATEAVDALMEQVGHLLRGLWSEDRREFAEEAALLAEQALDPKRADLIRSIPEALGLTQPTRS